MDPIGFRIERERERSLEIFPSGRAHFISFYPSSADKMVAVDNWDDLHNIVAETEMISCRRVWTWLATNLFPTYFFAIWMDVLRSSFTL